MDVCFAIQTEHKVDKVKLVHNNCISRVTVSHVEYSKPRRAKTYFFECLKTDVLQFAVIT